MALELGWAVILQFMGVLEGPGIRTREHSLEGLELKAGIIWQPVEECI